MLRKRTSFKPNLSQVSAAKPVPTSQHQPAPSTAAGPPTDVTQSHGADQTASTRSISPIKGVPINHDEADHRLDTSSISERENAAGDEQQHQDSTPRTLNTVAIAREIDDESSKRVHEAITQLTGQKFEPIKSISLRNSANKNVKLKDLLFFNPPLTKDQRRHRKNIHQSRKSERKRLAEEQGQSKETSDSINKDASNNKDNNRSTQDDTLDLISEEPSLVPKVKLGPDGKLILDESSTIINRKNAIKAQEAIIEDNEEIISRTNYDSYRRKPTSTSQTKWSSDDTQKFYQALTIFGTDFSMMESLLFEGHRSRSELHKKFKREERLNKVKVDIALANRISLDSEELDELRDVFYKT